ncbi:hypothetical protein NBZ79_13000 [Sneathiella marina]|uniref:DUF6898 domain-containing protein n=1 Tax=Sneathiella marina TaxID=2950108 RepID=A0ABY4W2I8_9PROT|nr:hypothetical protein [Sneathiella marina]USG60092.1 hypothetical protein NBZ79_13000 [Sneathiella marina]
MSQEDAAKEYIVEFEQHGASVKVSAIDPVTMTEVSIVGPSSAGQEELSRAAVQKLLFVLNKGKTDTSRSPASGDPKKPGIIV